jgi:hypothetical protein
VSGYAVVDFPDPGRLRSVRPWREAYPAIAIRSRFSGGVLSSAQSKWVLTSDTPGGSSGLEIRAQDSSYPINSSVQRVVKSGTGGMKDTRITKWRTTKTPPPR